MADKIKRNIAYKYRIGNLLAGSPIQEGERLAHLDIEGKQVIRTNVIANVIDKFIQEGEKKYGAMTLDDASGQIQIKFFGDDVDKIQNYNHGDTVMVIGLVRSWNNQIYLTPEIIKKKEPAYLLIRKLEIDKSAPKTIDKSKLVELKDKIITLVKDSEKDGGVGIDKIITDSKEPPEVINQEIKKLLEEGTVYEPRPGKLRWLG